MEAIASAGAKKRVHLATFRTAKIVLRGARAFRRLIWAERTALRKRACAPARRSVSSSYWTSTAEASVVDRENGAGRSAGKRQRRTLERFRHAITESSSGARRTSRKGSRAGAKPARRSASADESLAHSGDPAATSASGDCRRREGNRHVPRYQADALWDRFLTPAKPLVRARRLAWRSGECVTNRRRSPKAAHGRR